jgi:phenylacetaldehyde dehydrogenase
MNAPFQHRRLGRAAQEYVAGKHQLFIGGRFVDAQSGKTFDTHDPSTGRVIAQVAEGDAADIDAAVMAARQAFESGPWSRMSGSERAKLMWKLAELIEANRDELAELESLNNGKPIANIRNSDIVNSCEVLRYTAGWATKLNGETVSLSQPGNFHAYTLREPIGVVGQIIPWNAPLMMAAWKLAPALATGCTVVLKPAEQTASRCRAPRARSSIIRARSARPARGSMRTKACSSAWSKAWRRRRANSRSGPGSIPALRWSRSSRRSNSTASPATSHRAAPMAPKS